MALYKKFYVYKITNKVNGKVYIGKTNTLDARWAKHQSLAKKPNHEKHHLIHQAIAKYGSENFTFEEVEVFSNEKDALDRERYWIANYKSNVCKYGKENGYNLTDGGEGASGFVPSEATRKKMSDSQIGVQAGERHSLSKLKETDIQSIFKLIILGKKDEEIALLFKVGRKVISDIRRGKSWRHIMRPPGLANFSISKRKINNKDIYDILSLIKDGMSDQSIANHFLISSSAIRRIRLGIAWLHIPR